jgi:ribonuclease P protein component
VGKAHQRNRARRRHREAWRLNRHCFHGAVDVVLVARRGAVSEPFERIEWELMKLARRAGLVPSAG